MGHGRCILVNWLSRFFFLVAGADLHVRGRPGVRGEAGEEVREGLQGHGARHQAEPLPAHAGPTQGIIHITIIGFLINLIILLLISLIKTSSWNPCILLLLLLFIFNIVTKVSLAEWHWFIGWIPYITIKKKGLFWMLSSKYPLIDVCGVLWAVCMYVLRMLVNASRIVTRKRLGVYVYHLVYTYAAYCGPYVCMYCVCWSMRLELSPGSDLGSTFITCTFRV